MKLEARRIREVMNQVEELIEILDGEITRSRIGKGNLAKMLGISYKTFYRKLKSKRFSSEELLKIVTEVTKALDLRDEKRNSG